MPQVDCFQGAKPQEMALAGALSPPTTHLGHRFLENKARPFPSPRDPNKVPLGSGKGQQRAPQKTARSPSRRQESVVGARVGAAGLARLSHAARAGGVFPGTRPGTLRTRLRRTVGARARLTWGHRCAAAGGDIHLQGHPSPARTLTGRPHSLLRELRLNMARRPASRGWILRAAARRAGGLGGTSEAWPLSPPAAPPPGPPPSGAPPRRAPPPVAPLDPGSRVLSLWV